MGVGKPSRKHGQQVTLPGIVFLIIFALFLW